MNWTADLWGGNELKKCHMVVSVPELCCSGVELVIVIHMYAMICYAHCMLC
ncbi:hypothetical protein P168DRAFT_71251 [Aspergillus campestris IBT 28561]|uniref:Uncharacterized protein n=1 Tax=Aspergillus campestris (strain IBT 28561) TaxID=1392248 RepID=A0A2I1CSS1_ASPC2|nr:uncharacterized protein P168DRAFT_71251 [Aspergillus campestris IBT 28561]PKY00665.1 hypothetical protein P168DRAFT_71251 [Aspergillus campestris IBT 28561]